MFTSIEHNFVMFLCNIHLTKLSKLFTGLTQGLKVTLIYGAVSSYRHLGDRYYDPPNGTHYLPHSWSPCERSTLACCIK